MAQSFPEKAHLNIDPEKFKEGMERIYGKKPSVWCDLCEKRLVWCECDKSEPSESDSTT
jgi:hypothetical protein